MRIPLLALTALMCMIVAGLTAAQAQESKPAPKEKPQTASTTVKGKFPLPESELELTTPVACRAIRGYNDYDEMETPTLTPDEKLIVYYNVFRFKSKSKGSRYQIHLVQDGRIVRKRDDALMFLKDNMIDFTSFVSDRDGTLYLHSAVSLKGLRPGEYEFEVSLRDEVAKTAPVKRRVAFRVVASPDAKTLKASAPKPEKPASGSGPRDNQAAR